MQVAKINCNVYNKNTMKNSNTPSFGISLAPPKIHPLNGSYILGALGQVATKGHSPTARRTAKNQLFAAALRNIGEITKKNQG